MSVDMQVADFCFEDLFLVLSVKFDEIADFIPIFH